MLELSRLSILLGESAAETLRGCRAAVFGLGGVGSWAAEALARSGIGSLELVDDDVVEPSNLNRQLCALHSTLGRAKAEVMAERFLDINPELEARPRTLRFCADTLDRFDFSQYDCVLDCIDSVKDKALLIKTATDAGAFIISAMGAGGRTDPSAFRAGDIFETSGCPLARVMRRELRALGVRSLRCVWSEEQPRPPEGGVVGSAAFATPAMGLLMAAEIIKYLT